MGFLPHQKKRLREGGVGPQMRSAVGLEPAPQKETPLSGRRVGDAISEGVRGPIMAICALAVKRLAFCAGLEK